MDGMRPLAIVQARMASTRLPGKMMLPLNGHPLVYHAWRRSVEAFGEVNVVVAMPISEENDTLAEFIKRIGGQVFRWDGPEEDVLGRFYFCANAYRWHPQSVIVRITPDDFRKDVHAMKAVAAGARLPVEIGAEAFTLEQLLIAHAYVTDPAQREHITHAIFPTPPPPAPEGLFTIDTEEDYEAAKKRTEWPA